MPPIFFVQTRRKRQKALSLLAFLSMDLAYRVPRPCAPPCKLIKQGRGLPLSSDANKKVQSVRHRIAK